MIISNENKKIRMIRALSTKKGREKYNLYVAEGDTLVREYINYPQIIEFILISDKYDKEILNSNEIIVYKAEDKVFNSVCETKNSQGILAVVKKNKSDISQIIKSNIIIFANAIQDPGNIGTIIRSMDAFGASSLVCGCGCVDIFNSKTVRSTMGSINRVTFYNSENDLETLNYLKENGFKIYSAVVDSEIYLDKLNETNKSVIIIGNESKGISENIIKASDIKFSIRMSGKAESLNAGVAASICLFHFNNKLIENY